MLKHNNILEINTHTLTIRYIFTLSFT